jgi:outer membrane protein assembly factor BamB
MTEGEVKVGSEGDWKDAGIGDELPVATRIKTGAASSCDLAFGNLGAVRIGPESVVDLRRLAISATKRSAELSIGSGSVACKVSKLMSKDSFEVRSPESVCGVRGTEFLVKVSKGKPLVVAVQEGKVALLPPSFDSAKIEALASTPAGEAVASAVIEELSAQAPLVQAGEESRVEAAAMAGADATVSAVVASLAANIAAVEAAAAQQAPAAPEAPAAAAPAEQPKAAAPQGAAPSGPAGQPQAAAEAKAIPLPQEVLAALAKYIEVAPKAVAKPAAISAESKSVMKDLPQPLPEKPLPKQPDQSSLAPQPAAEAPAKDPASAAASPPPAAEPAQAVQPAATPVVARQPKAEDAITLVTLTGEDLASGLIAASGGAFAADAKGRISSFDATGKRLWTASTDNGDNTNSRPVAVDGKVYYAGDAKLAALEISTGKKVFSQGLDAANSGLFGRRPLVHGNRLYLSSDSGLDAFDAASGAKLAAISLPDGSDMTPAAIDPGRICLATRGGSFCIVDVASGKLAASIATKSVQPVACSPLVSGKLAFFADRKGLVTCVDLSAEAVKWSQPLEPGKSLGVYQDPELGGKALFFFAKSAIYALSLSDGRQPFAPLRNAAAAPCLAQGKLWYGTSASTVVGADPETGKVVATVNSPSQVTGKACLVRGADGRSLLLFPTEGGILALDLALLAQVR